MTTTTLLGERYRLVARIARGGMADVWEGYDTLLERRVAVKVVRAGTGEDTVALVDEILALGRLNHPSIVGLYDAGEQDGEVFLVLELVEGATLRERLGKGPLPAAQVRQVGAAVAAALAHAHDAGIVHRDVKPSNILLGEGGARLADFGIARALDSSRATVTDALLGTAGYLAPEQVTGEGVGPAADVYSLGLVLLEAVTARREYPGPAVEAAFARLARDPAIPDDLDPALAEVLRRMLARTSDERPTAAEVAAALPLPAATGETAPLPRRRRPPSRGRRRRSGRREVIGTRLVRGVAALAAVVLVGGAAVIGASLNGGEAAEETQAEIVPASGPTAPLHPDVDEALRELEAAVTR